MFIRRQIILSASFCFNPHSSLLNKMEVELTQRCRERKSTISDKTNSLQAATVLDGRE